MDLLILEVEIDGKSFILINFHNMNTELEQKVSKKLLSHIKLLNIDKHSAIVGAGDFNFL